MRPANATPQPTQVRAARPLPVFARLARRRPDLTSAHLSLSWAVEPSLPRGSSGAEASARPVPTQTQPSGTRAAPPLLALAVAKRLLPRAVDRNAFKRVSREAWRSRCASAPCPSHAFLRVRQASSDWARMPTGRRKQVWRQEIDALFARMRLDAPRPPAAAGRGVEGAPR